MRAKKGETAVAAPKKKAIPRRPEKSKSISKGKASASEKKSTRAAGKESEQIREDCQDSADENVPSNISDNRSRNKNKDRLRAVNIEQNGRSLRSRRRPATGSKSACANQGTSAGTTSSNGGKSIKEPQSDKEESNRAVLTDNSLACQPGNSAASPTKKISIGRDESVDTSVAQNVSSKVPAADNRLPSEEHSRTQSTSTGENPKVADEAGTTLSKTRVVDPKGFYRSSAAPPAQDLKERLAKLSFSKVIDSIEEIPSPEMKKKRKARTARTQKKKKKSDGATAKARDKFAKCPGTTFHVSTVKEPLSIPQEAKKFFKHRIPVSRFLCTMVGGVAKFSAAPLEPSENQGASAGTTSSNREKGIKETKTGKEGSVRAVVTNSSHVAKEGGNCKNSNLASVDDMQGKGISKDSSSNLRKRNSTTSDNQKYQKRRRSSSWNCVAEDDAPVGKSPDDPERVVPVVDMENQIKEPKPTAQVNDGPGRARPRLKRMETFSAEGTELKTASMARSALANNPSGNGQRRLRLSGSDDFQILTRDLTRPSRFIACRDRYVSKLRRRKAASRDEDSTILVAGGEFSEEESPPVPEDPIIQPKTSGSVDEVASRKKQEQNQNAERSQNQSSLLHPNALSNGASQKGRLRQRSVRFSNVDAYHVIPAQPASRPVTPRPSCTKNAAPTVVVDEPGPEAGTEDASHCFSPIPCESPRLSPPPPPSDPPQNHHYTPILQQCSSSEAPENSDSGLPYDPRHDAFGFDRMQFKSRPIQNPFVEVCSPEKVPKELMPKIMKRKQTQPLVKDVLKNVAHEIATSTPMKAGIGPRLSHLIPDATFLRRDTNTRFTSTPVGPTQKVGFYGASSSSTTKTDGFKGLRRLADRMGQKQLQIDAGQKKFGAKECRTCGMIFSQGEAEDEREHQKFHKQMDSALQVRLLEGVNVIDVLPDVGRVVLVSARDSRRVKDKLADVVEFANRTVGLDFETVRADFVRYDKRIFAVFVHDSGKIVSVIGAEPCSLAYRTLPGQDLVVDTSKRLPVKKSIFFIWTLPEFRRKGLAALLLYKLRVILRAKEEPLTFDELAFADLTADLHKFVTALSGQDTVLVAAPPDPNLEALL